MTFSAGACFFCVKLPGTLPHPVDSACEKVNN